MDCGSRRSACGHAIQISAPTTGARLMIEERPAHPGPVTVPIEMRQRNIPGRRQKRFRAESRDWRRRGRRGGRSRAPVRLKSSSQCSMRVGNELLTAAKSWWRSAGVGVRIEKLSAKIPAPGLPPLRKPGLKVRRSRRPGGVALSIAMPQHSLVVSHKYRNSSAPTNSRERGTPDRSRRGCRVHDRRGRRGTRFFGAAASRRPPPLLPAGLAEDRSAHGCRRPREPRRRGSDREGQDENFDDPRQASCDFLHTQTCRRRSAARDCAACANSRYDAAMFLTFFAELRQGARAGDAARISRPRQGARPRGRRSRSIEDFYRLSRALLVKDERNLDKFNVVFASVFKGIISLGQAVEAAEMPEEWLRKLMEKFLSPEERAEIAQARLRQVDGDAA